MHLKGLLFVGLVCYTFFALCDTVLPHVVHEKRVTSSQWVKRAKLPSTAKLPVRIALAQRNLENGYDYLMDISSPASPKYGKHWTPIQVADTFIPSDLSFNKAMKWLMDAGISKKRIVTNKQRGHLSLDMTVEELEDLVQAEYHIYHQAQLDEHTVACDQYHIPEHLKSHIDFITPGVSLSSSGRKPRHKKRHQKRELQNSDCDSPIFLNKSLENCWLSAAPECLNALYNIPTSSDSGNPENTFAIFEWDVTYIQSDMDKFFANIATQIPVGTTPQQIFVNGANMTTEYNNVTALLIEEAELDFQTAWPLVYPHNLALFNANLTIDQFSALISSASDPDAVARSLPASLGGALGIEDMLSYFDSTYCANTNPSPCGIAEPPKVISISYAPNELALSEAQMKRICNEFLKLGLQGTTVVICTGDGGVADRNGLCYGPDQNVFNPGALVSCPYVTSVGASMIAPEASVSDPEIAAVFQASNLTSAGGFGNYFPAPQYQQSAIANYFYRNPSPYPTYAYNGSAASIGANGGRFNRLGRGVPDVSATGNNLTVVYNDCLANYGGGTSMAAPIFAAVVHLLNEERLAANKSTLGFVNPALYANPQVLNDISGGRNFGCGFNISEGFEAVNGWDPVTGLGTPNYPRMRSLFMSLP